MSLRTAQGTLIIPMKITLLVISFILSVVLAADPYLVPPPSKVPFNPNPDIEPPQNIPTTNNDGAPPLQTFPNPGLNNFNPRMQREEAFPPSAPPLALSSAPPSALPPSMPQLPSINSETIAIKRLGQQGRELFKRLQMSPRVSGTDSKFDGEIRRLRMMIQKSTRKEAKCGTWQRALPPRLVKAYLHYLEWQDRWLSALLRKIKSPTSCKNVNQLLPAPPSYKETLRRDGLIRHHNVVIVSPQQTLHQRRIVRRRRFQANGINSNQGYTAATRRTFKVRHTNYSKSGGGAVVVSGGGAVVSGGAGAGMTRRTNFTLGKTLYSSSSSSSSGGGVTNSGSSKRTNLEYYGSNTR